jgi:hypothetical protein
MSAATDVEVCNLALDHIGKKTITSLTENSTESQRCVRQYPMARRLVMKASPWSFARKVSALAKLTNDQTDRWLCKYDYPSDCLKWRRLLGPYEHPEERKPPYPSFIQNGAIYTDLSDAHGYYTFDNVEVPEWDDLFTEAVAIQLAKRLAPAMVRRQQDVQRLHDMYTDALAQAIEHDAQQDVTTYRWGDGYADARGHGTDAWEHSPQTDKSSIWDN